jgi:hypothetical protein
MKTDKGSALLVVVVLLALIIIAGGSMYAYGRFNFGMESQEGWEDSEVDVEYSSDEEKPLTVEDAVGKGKNLRCAIDKGEFEEVFYVSGNKVRADNPEGSEYKLIIDGTTHYMWEGKQGMKGRAWKDQNVYAMMLANPEEMKPFTVKCETWIPDASYFVPPADVIFRDNAQQ